MLSDNSGPLLQTINKSCEHVASNKVFVITSAHCNPLPTADNIFHIISVEVKCRLEGRWSGIIGQVVHGHSGGKEMRHVTTSLL